jgi:sugar-specific transcriptional regulator TrmB/DNA-binding CsgD family transcriptional regulator
MEADIGSPLEVFGIGADEERAYRTLLVMGVGTAEDFARNMALPLRKAQRLLDAIEAKGLTTHSPEQPRRYIPASPDIAIQALAHQHQRAVQRAKGMIDELQLHAVAGRKETKEQQELPIELITTPDVGRLVYQQIYESAEHEILGLVRPPLLYSVLSSPPDSSAQQAVHARGVRHRSISDAGMLSIPGFPERLRADIEAGEEARLMTSVPFKMVLIDCRIALMFLHPDQANSPSVVVRYSALLDALHTLFEILWERAAPVSFTRSGELQKGTGGSRLSKEDEELVWMMAIGMNDKTIAHNLQVSVRTLERYVAELMRNLDARTRFQAGWDAALYLSSTGSSRKPQGNRGAKRNQR